MSDILLPSERARLAASRMARLQGEALYDALKKIVDEKQYAKIHGQVVDLFSASAMVQVADALNEANREKFLSLPLAKAHAMTFRVLKKGGKTARFTDGPKGEKEWQAWFKGQPKDFQDEWKKENEANKDKFKSEESMMDKTDDAVLLPVEVEMQRLAAADYYLYVEDEPGNMVMFQGPMGQSQAKAKQNKDPKINEIVDEGGSASMVPAAQIKRDLGSSSPSYFAKLPKADKARLDEALKGGKKASVEDDLLPIEMDRLAAGGLYGYPKQTQQDVEVTVRKAQKRAADIAKTLLAKDERSVQFLQTHAKRSQSASAQLILAAMADLPKVASETEILPSERAAASGRSAGGLYGFPTKMARMCLAACADYRSFLGEATYDLHSRREANWERITGYLRDHTRAAKCNHSRMLLGCYPDPPSMDGKTAADGWWEVKRAGKLPDALKEHQFGPGGAKGDKGKKDDAKDEKKDDKKDDKGKSKKDDGKMPADLLEKFKGKKKASGAVNARYLASIPVPKKAEILKAVAKHYSVSVREIESELTDPEAEELYEYLAFDNRMAMQVYREFQGGRFAAKSAPPKEHQFTSEDNPNPKGNDKDKDGKKNEPKPFGDKKKADFDPNNIGKTEPGALLYEADEPYMKGNFTEQESTELSNKMASYPLDTVNGWLEWQE